MSLSDRIVVMNGGYCRADGYAQDDLRTAAHTFVAASSEDATCERASSKAREGKSVVFSMRCWGNSPPPASTAWGTIQAARALPIALRPEKDSGSGAGADENCRRSRPGTLKYTGFLGSIVRIVVELAPGDEVVVEAQALPDAQVGEKVTWAGTVTTRSC